LYKLGEGTFSNVYKGIINLKSIKNRR